MTTTPAVTDTAALTDPVPGHGPTGRTRLIRGATVISLDPQLGVVPDGDILVRDGIIIAVRSGLDAPSAEVLDARGTIAIPGFVDSHVHAWEGRRLRGLPRPHRVRSHGPAAISAADPVTTVVTMAHPGMVDTVLVAGELRKHRGRLVGVDVAATADLVRGSREYLLDAASAPMARR